MADSALPTPLAALEAASIAAPERPQNLLGLGLDELTAQLLAMGETRFRARQAYQWALKHRVQDFAAMQNLSLGLRARMAERFVLTRPSIDKREVARDGTRKYRFVAADNTAFEAVYIPEVARGRGTNTLCISSQSGCAVGCKFCFTASLRRNRNLATDEIVGQVLAVQDDVAPLGEGARVTNIVFMGMGEPLLNYDNVVRAARLLICPLGMDFSSRRVTLSTSGIVPRLEQLGHDVPIQVAISLNATTDEVRTKIMPINKKWPLATLLAALRAYPLRPRRRFTIEYVMLGGVNDTLDDARRLCKLLHDIPVKLNLLPLNAHERTSFVPPCPNQVMRFQKVLQNAGFNVFVRTPRGQDISAACGQLGETITPQQPAGRASA